VDLEEAKKILGGKLVFGDRQQIKAREYWEKVEAAKAAILGCDYFDEHLACGIQDLLDCSCIREWVWDDGESNKLLKDALREAKGLI
jgi:hypothetical protein